MKRRICATELKAEDLIQKSLKVEYEANSIDEWRLFFDGEEVHLITVDCVSGVFEYNSAIKSYYSGIEELFPEKCLPSWYDPDEVYSLHCIPCHAECVWGKSSRDDLLDWIKDSTKWKKFASGIPGAKATGGPTLEQFIGCWNIMTQMKQHQIIGKNCFNLRPKRVLIPHERLNDDYCWGYWLASSYLNDYMWSVAYSGWVCYDIYYTTYNGVRPLVSLTSEVGLEYDEDLQMWLLV